jgi:hypothetical protein
MEGVVEHWLTALGREKEGRERSTGGRRDRQRQKMNRTSTHARRARREMELLSELKCERTSESTSKTAC